MEANVAMIFKDGKIIYHHIENSLNPREKIFMRIQFFQYGQCQNLLQLLR